MSLLIGLTWFSGVAFIYFGINCFCSEFIISEFKRYKLPAYRKLTGFLQLAGALGLLIGIIFKPLLITAAVGLFLLMLSGFIVRLKIKDSLSKSLPSLSFALLNLYIAFKTFIVFY